MKWQLTDAQGSVRLLTDANGTATDRYDYTPFGESLGAGVGTRAGTPGYTGGQVRHRFAGMTNDYTMTELEDTPWRKMDSKAGRWTTPDPYLGSMSVSDPQSMNRYAYVQNDPVNFVDPSGLNMSSGGCSAEFSYSQCGGDAGFWGEAGGGGIGSGGGGSFGDGVAEYNATYGDLPPNIAAQLGLHFERISNSQAGYGFITHAEVTGSMNFNIYYRLYSDGSLSTNFNIGVNVGGSLSSWQRANDRTSNFVYGLTNSVSLGLVDWAIAFDRRHGLGEHNEINPNSGDAQAGALAAVFVPGPGGKIGAVRSLKPIVIGETMTRVINFAKANGATWYKARGTNPANWLRNNMQWLRRQMQQGRTIIDIGTDPLRPTRSPYYRAERNLLERNGYPTRRP